MRDPIRDPRTPSSALELDERELNELDPTQRNALARHPNTPMSTLERLARHHPETGPAIATNPALPLHTMRGPLPAIVQVTLGSHPPTQDLAVLRQHLTLYGQHEMYQIALRLHLIEQEEELEPQARAAIEGQLYRAGVPA